MTKNFCLLILLLTSFTLLVGVNLPVGLTHAQTNQSSGGDNNMYNLTSAGKIYPVKYQITGGKLNNMTTDINKGALLVDISSQSDGNLTVELPRNVLDSKKPGGSDEQFAVFQDGQNSDFEEKANNNQSRTLAINFDKGTQEIEIDGTKVLPITSIPSPAKTTPSTTITVQGNKTTVVTGLSASSKSTQSPSGGPSNTSASSSSKSPSNSTYNLKIDSKKTIPIEYQISGNGNKLNSITVQKDNTTLLTSISSQSDGKLIVELPRKIIDSKKQGNKDTDYAVFQDGQDAAADEIKNNNQVRTLAINFDKGTQEIEISGTQIVPEFGNIAIITMIFAMAIVALILTGSKYNKGLSTFMQK